MDWGGDTSDPTVGIIAQEVNSLNNYDTTANYSSIGYSGSTDTITIDNTTMASLGSISLPSAAINTGGYYGNWNTTPTVNITNKGIDMPAGADIMIDGASLKEFMKKMEQRLAILVPNPEKLEKFKALKKAYEHYKTMESLCFDEQINESK